MDTYWNMKKLRKTQWTLLLALLGLAIGTYAIGLSLYIINPWWVKGGSMTETILFIVVAILLILGALLYRRLQSLEASFNEKLKRLRGRGKTIKTKLRRTK